jgi:hypothetical protein
VPFCHWQTYIEAGQSTLRWFSCVETSIPDETLFASTITNNLLGANPSGSSTNGKSSSVNLSTGVIAGIVVAGAVTIIACVVVVSFACLRVRRRKAEHAASGTAANPASPHLQPGYVAVSSTSAHDAKPPQQQDVHELPGAEPHELPADGVAEMADTGYEGQWDAHQHQQQQQQRDGQERDGQHEPTPPPGQGPGFASSPHFTPPPGQRFSPPQHERYTPPPPQQQPQPGYSYGQADPQHLRQYSR